MSEKPKEGAAPEQMPPHITVVENPDGGLGVQSNIQDPYQILGMLERAKNAVLLQGFQVQPKKSAIAIPGLDLVRKLGRN